MHVSSSSKVAACMRAPSISTLAFIESENSLRETNLKWSYIRSWVSINWQTSSQRVCLGWLSSAIVAHSWASEFKHIGLESVRPYYARACHVAQYVHVISFMDCLCALHWNNVAFILCICACFIRDRDSESLPMRGSGDDRIWREFFLCLLWRRIHVIDNGSIFIGRDFSGIKLS